MKIKVQHKIQSFYRMGLIVIAAIIIVSMGMLVVSCKDNKSEDKSDDLEETATSNVKEDLIFTLEEQADFIEGFHKHLERDKVVINEEQLSEIDFTNVPSVQEEPVITSHDLVQMAFEAEEINREQYAYYTVLCGYNDTLLPEEYQAEFSYGLNIQGEVVYIIDHWDELSDEIQDGAEGFLAPIDQPESIFYPREKTSKHNSGNVVYADPISDAIFTESFTYDNVTYTIQYPTSYASNDDLIAYFDKMVIDIETAIAEGYPKFKNLLGTGLYKPVRIEILPLGSYYGETWEEATEYRLRLNSKVLDSTKLTKTTLVHELFHDFQYGMGIEYTTTNLRWAMEATATWSEHLVYNSLNTEHEYLGDFFSTLDKDRVDADDKFEYGSYMLFYYLTDYADSNVVVSAFLNKCADGGTSAVRGFFDAHYSEFKEIYGKFALYNIDATPLVYYNDFGPLPGMAEGSALKAIKMAGFEEDDQDVTLESGGIQYYVYEFKKNDDNAKHIKFTFDQSIINDKHMRQAAIYADGVWRIEDWSELTEIKYCRDSTDVTERVDAVILIYSNADLTNTGPVTADDFNVKTEDCPDEVKITINATYTISGYGFEWISISKLVDYCKVIDHNLFVSYDSDYTLEATLTKEGMMMLETSGQSHHTVMNEVVDISTGFPRIFYPGALGDDELYTELTAFGFSENIPETGLLMTIPFFEDELNGSSTFYFPEPVGTMTENIPWAYDGISMIGGVILPEDIRDGNEISFQQTIDTQNYDPPIANMFNYDFDMLTEQLAGMEGVDIEMPDMSEFDLPEGFEMPTMENPMGDVMEGLMSIMNPSSGYTTILDINVEIEWPDE